MLSIKHIKKLLILGIMLLVFRTSMSLTLNDSFNLNENESYYEFSKDLALNSIININLNNIIIDGKNYSFTGSFNIYSKNVTFQNINFKNYNNFISASNSSINIINCAFENSENAINIINSNFSLTNNLFFNINNLLKINANYFSANISLNDIKNVNNSIIFSSPFLIDDKIINLNNNNSNFYDLFKMLKHDANGYFNNKQFFNHDNLIYEVANNYTELLDLIKKKSKNISFGANITANKIISFTNNINIYGKNNYFISQINKEYSLVLIGEINFTLNSLNIDSNSNIAISNMGANAKISNSSIYAKDIGYYQLEGILNISDSNFYFLNESEKKTGMHIETGQITISNTNFFNATTGIILFDNSMLNGRALKCINHPTYTLLIADIENDFSADSVIIPQKLKIYENEYDYYNKITISNLEQNNLCSYPGFLLNEKYPWEIEYELVLNELKNLIGLKTRTPDSALDNLNLISLYNNYSIKYFSKSPELLTSNGEVINPYLNQKVASMEVNILKNDLGITFPLNIVILPIIPINSSRIESNGTFQLNELIIKNDFEMDSSNLITKGNTSESIKIFSPQNETILILKNGNKTLFNSSIDNYYELILNLLNSSGILAEINDSYDFYWIKEGKIYLIERLNIKLINEILLKSSTIVQSYNNNINQIIFLSYYSDYENGIIDFSNSLKNNTVILQRQLKIERDLGNLISIIIPPKFYSIDTWDGLFLMPTLIKDFVYENENSLFAFKVGSENLDLYSTNDFLINISGFSGFNAGFKNSSGIYELPKSNYYSLGNDLIIKTKHLSTFFIYQKKPKIIEEQNVIPKELVIQNESILQNISLNEEVIPKIQSTTGLITLSILSQQEYLSIIRLIFSILLIYAIIIAIKKNFFH
ncbi:MAG: hypothetical protein PHN56_04165 [Candidatus Nanoarchaeia archaeon]|nr:hypothetical protein [Candidatus Nanoarchaeia archaeon]